MRFIEMVFLIALVLAAGIRPARASEPELSLQPLLAGADCEDVPGLVGDWTTDGDMTGSWTVQKMSNGLYRLFEKPPQPDTSNRSAFDICVAHFGGYLFFDATGQMLNPAGTAPIAGDDGLPFWIPAHFIGRLSISDGAIRFELLDDGWLDNALQSRRVQLAHVCLDNDGCFLVASTAELKRFVVAFETDPEAFSYLEEFDRVVVSFSLVPGTFPALATFRV